MKRNKVKCALLLIASITATTGFCVSANEVKTSSQQFEQLLNEHWQMANKEQIFFRKDPDAFRMNGKLPSFSKASEKRRETYNQSLLNKLDKIELSTLSPKEQVSYRLFKYERQTEAKSYQQLDRFYPMNIYAGFHSYFAGAPANMSFLTVKDYDNYLISLADFPRYNQEHIDNLTEAVAQGHTHYCESFKVTIKVSANILLKMLKKVTFISHY